MGEYQEALDTVHAHHNLCILGPAGTGKTYLIKEMHANLS
jgi:DNA replication protein DnaC